VLLKGSVRTSAQARRWMGKPADVCGYDEGTEGGIGSPGVMHKEYHLFAQSWPGHNVDFIRRQTA